MMEIHDGTDRYLHYHCAGCDTEHTVMVTASMLATVRKLEKSGAAILLYCEDAEKPSPPDGEYFSAVVQVKEKIPAEKRNRLDKVIMSIAKHKPGITRMQRRRLLRKAKDLQEIADRELARIEKQKDMLERAKDYAEEIQEGVWGATA